MENGSDFMRVVTIEELQEKSINALIEENVRFTIPLTETEEVYDGEDEGEVGKISDKIILLKRQYDSTRENVSSGVL